MSGVPRTFKTFCTILHGFYQSQGRHTLPWRTKSTPYRVWISEVMLQQTQVDRVVPKFKAWVKQFPTVRALARAPQREVIRAWQGLGYNRRALNIHRAAKIILEKHSGCVPRDKGVLVALPGIGPYTAGAIRAFAWNESEVFIETNIRRVFLHHFFPNKKKVDDKKIFPLVEQCMRLKVMSPRAFYSALMDYGSHLAKVIPNPNVRSRHYAKQSTFKGSNRELRGKILRILVRHDETRQSLYDKLPASKERIGEILDTLKKESLISVKEGVYFIP